MRARVVRQPGATFVRQRPWTDRKGAATRLGAAVPDGSWLLPGESRSWGPTTSGCSLALSPSLRVLRTQFGDPSGCLILSGRWYSPRRSRAVSVWGQASSTFPGAVRWLLARHLTTLDMLLDGQLPLGLGMRWSSDEVEVAGAPWQGRGNRIHRSIWLPILRPRCGATRARCMAGFQLASRSAPSARCLTASRSWLGRHGGIPARSSSSSGATPNVGCATRAESGRFHGDVGTDCRRHRPPPRARRGRAHPRRSVFTRCGDFGPDARPHGAAPQCRALGEPPR